MLWGEIAPQNTQLTTIHAWHWAHFCFPQRQRVRHCGFGHGMAERAASAETACRQNLHVTSSPESGAPQLEQVGLAPPGGPPPGPFHWLMNQTMTQRSGDGNRTA